MIDTGENAVATDFIDQSERDATPANDAGRVPKLESDGKLDPFFMRDGFVPNAGESIAGATLPVPVYQSITDNEVYACDADDATKYKFVGFAISTSTDGNPIRVQTKGIVPGFSGLDEGERYYIQDTAGQIGKTPGTQEILVGIAISPTELLILKGRRFASGSLALTTDGVGATLTLGFRPSAVRIYATNSNVACISVGGWTINGGNICAWISVALGTGTSQSQGTTGRAFHLPSASGSNPNYGSVSVSDTGFSLSYNQNAATTYIRWEAEGEI